jgi:hypothetical protein
MKTTTDTIQLLYHRNLQWYNLHIELHCVTGMTDFFFMKLDKYISTKL